MKVLVTGGAGMLGRAVVQEFQTRGHEVAAFGRAELDVTRPDEVRRKLEQHRPDVVIQCAAYTAVDAAESEPEEAVRVNGMGAEIVVDACQRMGAAFVYPSTDYVFSGESQRPWNPKDRPAPLNAYGRSKMAGEQAALSSAGSMVVRTSWLYGAGGANFVDAIADLAREGGEIEVVNDQVGIPTWTGSLAGTLASLVESGASGIFHASDGGEPVSWFDFASEIVERQGFAARIRPVTSIDHPRPARRPLYSVLDCTATECRIGRPMASWREMLAAYLQSHRDV